MSSTTKIPGDDPGRSKFMYHPTIAGSRRVDLKDRDIAEAELQKLRAEGWQERRVAVMLYHQRLGAKVFRSDADVSNAKRSGWQDVPFATGAHPDAVHPHHEDEHRLTRLAMDAAATEDPDKKDEDEDAKKRTEAEAKAAERAAKDAEKAAIKAAKDAERAAK